MIIMDFGNENSMAKSFLYILRQTCYDNISKNLSIELSQTTYTDSSTDNVTVF